MLAGWCSTPTSVQFAVSYRKRGSGLTIELRAFRISRIAQYGVAEAGDRLRYAAMRNWGRLTLAGARVRFRQDIPGERGYLAGSKSDSRARFFVAVESAG